MRSIFENEIYTPDVLGMGVVSGERQLARTFADILGRMHDKNVFLWSDTVDIAPMMEDVVTSFGHGVSYIEVADDASADDVLTDPDIPFYQFEYEADSDDSVGVLLFDGVTDAVPEIRDLAMDIAFGECEMFLPKGWIVVLTGNIDMKDIIWKPAFDRYLKNIFVSESVNEGFTEDMGVNALEELKTKVYNIIRNALLKDEISPDEYIFVAEDGVVVASEEDFDTDVIYYTRKADYLIDFLPNGDCRINKERLFDYVEEAAGLNSNNL